MKTAFLLIPLLAAASSTASWAQDRIFRCGNEYTNTVTVAEAKNCKLVSGGNITVVQSAKPNAWDIGAVAPLQGSIAKGDKLQVLVWARLDTEDPKAKAVVPMLLQVGAPPYTAVISGSVTLTSKLEAVAIGGAAAESFAGGTVNLALQLGQLGQPVVLSAPYVLKNYKPAP